MSVTKFSGLRGLLTLAALYGAFAANTAEAVVIALEDFDGGAINLSGTANVFDMDAGGGTGGDVFGRVVPGVTSYPFDVADDSAVDVSGGTFDPNNAFPGDVLGIAGQNTSAFFAINDADGLGGLNDATWTFDISGGPALSSIQIDLAAMGDFEASSTDGFEIQARVDANAYQTIFLARTNEAIDHEYRPMDGGAVVTLNDPLELFIDGSVTPFGVLDKNDPVSGGFDTYTSLLLAGATGSTLDIKVNWAGSPSGSEPQGIDNITVNGVPEPTTCMLMLIGLAGMASRRRL